MLSERQASQNAVGVWVNGLTILGDDWFDIEHNNSDIAYSQSIGNKFSNP